MINILQSWTCGRVLVAVGIPFYECLLRHKLSLLLILGSWCLCIWLKSYLLYHCVLHELGRIGKHLAREILSLTECAGVDYDYNWGLRHGKYTVWSYPPRPQGNFKSPLVSLVTQSEQRCILVRYDKSILDSVHSGNRNQRIVLDSGNILDNLNPTT